MTTDRTAALEAAQRITGGHARSLHPGSSDYFEAGDAIEVALALLSTAKEADRMREVVERISKQPLSSELSEDVRCDADFEGGYDALIHESRAALLPSEGTKT